jgi:methylphosphotriester-DNA--protein-cysteine methyltransferase
MQRMVLSTDDIPEAERFSYWRAAVNERLMGVCGERNKDQERPFNARLAGTIGGSVTHFRCRADGHPAFRRPRDIARRNGTTFAQFVLRRRHEECRTTLMSPIAGRSVIDVAFAWGFSSLATFYRTFHEAFGMAPGALRAEANHARGARTLPH